MRASWVLPMVCVSFLAGIVLFCLAPVPFGAFLAVTGAGCLFGARQRSVFIVVCFAGAALGAIRFEAADAHVRRMQAQAGRQQEITAVILRKEVPRPTTQRLLLAIPRVSKTDIRLTLADLPRFPEFEEGQRLRLDCLWQPPTTRQEISALRNRYAKGLYLRCDVQAAELISRELPCARHPLLCGRKWIVAQVEALWPRPTRSLVLGLLLGDKADFPAQVLRDFSTAGISHIIALSGFNITIIIVSLEAVALRLAVRKNWRAPAIVAVIGIFVIFVGSAASIVRAACMGCLALVGKTCGRRTSATRLLLVSAAAMTLANPFTLLYDVGFQLSCLATFGLLAFSEPFEHWLRFIPERGALRGSLATTLAASLPTLPLLAFQFGSLSIVSPLTNMLVLPLIPHLMWTGALAVVVHPLSVPLSSLMARGVTHGCHYILDVSAKMAAVPWAAAAVQMPAWLCVTCSFLIIAYGSYLQKGARI